MSEQHGEDFTGAELDEPLVDDLLDETRRPEDYPEADDTAEGGTAVGTEEPAGRREQPDPPTTPETPEPPD